MAHCLYFLISLVVLLRVLTFWIRPHIIVRPVLQPNAAANQMTKRLGSTMENIKVAAHEASQSHRELQLAQAQLI